MRFTIFLGIALIANAIKSFSSEAVDGLVIIIAVLAAVDIIEFIVNLFKK